MHDDHVSLAMFWAGMMFVFTPVICASIVIGIWWWQKKRAASAADSPRAGTPDRG
jgi:hypothetical protein